MPQPKKNNLFAAVDDGVEATFTEFGATAPLENPPANDSGVHELSPAVPAAPVSSKKAAKAASRLEGLAVQNKPSTKKVTFDFDMPVYEQLQSFHGSLRAKGIKIPLRTLVQTALVDFIEAHAHAAE